MPGTEEVLRKYLLDKQVGRGTHIPIHNMCQCMVVETPLKQRLHGVQKRSELTLTVSWLGSIIFS